MKKLLITTGILTFTLSSCLNEEETLPIENNWVEIEEMSGVQHDITINILANKFGGYVKGQSQTRSLSSFTLTPYVENGDTLLYIAQYSDGWEIYSADKRFPMILISGEGLYSDKKKIPVLKTYIDLIANNIKEVKNMGLDNVIYDSSWAWETPDENIETFTNEVDYPDPKTGDWDVISWVNLEPQTTEVNHMIKTKWGAGIPWNQYIPYVMKDNNMREKGDVGSVPVAFAQYLYYHNSKYGIPVTAPTQSQYSSRDNTYQHYNFQSEAWKQMALNNIGNDSISFARQRRTATYLGHISNMCECEFVSGTTMFGLNYAVDKCLNSSLNCQFLIKEPENDAEIINLLKRGEPVLAYANDSKHSNKEYGFIIDGYQEEIRNSVITYGWNGKMKSGRDPNMRDEEGNIISYGITKTIEQSTKLSNYKMNWGLSGNGDDTYCNTGSWSPKLSHYDINLNKNRRIIVKQ